LTEKILLLTAQTERELNNSRINLHQNKIVIKNQSISILVLALSVIIISTFLTIVIVQRRKLNAAYHTLVARTMQLIDNDSLKHQTHDHPMADKQTSALLHHLESLMTGKQLYLDPEISMTNLAKHLCTNEKYLSMLFNQQLNTSFNDYINSLRITEACRMMTTTGKPVKSIDQIAEDAGFRSRSAFYTAFKKHTGVTPAFFMKSNPGKCS
jgi:AraC-like DNA-binding protein